MGTSYYLEELECFACGRVEKPIHMCKISAGWKPLFKRHNGLDSMQAFKRFTKVARPRIVDEYGVEHEMHVFWEMLESHQRQPDLRSHIALLHSRNLVGYVDKDGYEFGNGEFC